MLLRFPFSYLLWHYTLAWADLLRLYTNFVWFLWNFFSVRLLLSTFFAPWKRLRESRSVKEEGGFLGRLILNSVTRLVGIAARSVVVVMGLVSIALPTLFFAALLVLWLILPVAPFFLVIGALYHLVVP